MKQNIPIAIIGMGCFFPKSSGLKQYWRLLFHGEDAITDIPDSHWSPEDYYDADPGKPDHVYCKRGGFLSPISFDPTEFAIPPSSLEAIDTAQILGLVAAKKAIEDAGYGEETSFNRDRVSVILGATGTQELVIPLGARLGHPKWLSALKDAGVPADKAAEVIERISDSYVSWQENSFPGLLGNVIAGRICNRLDLGGTNCVVDAACASSMSAIYLAAMELYSNRSDMVVTGGVDALNDIFMHMCFSETQTLSPTGDVRPFSKDADGTVLGEGIGMLVLKRLTDAEKDGNRIYAVLKAIGSSSDGKSQSIYAPRKEGQIKALRTAYEYAGVDPTTVGLIEAHGTGTRVGDIVEFQALTQFFNDRPENADRCALGSVKSMIGHTKAAAGAAGLIKSALALYNKVLPPTLKTDEPSPNMDIDESPFYLSTETRPWFSKNRHPRRSGVSAFGFGGSNFHVVLEEHQRNKQEVSWDGSIEIIALSAPTQNELTERLRSLINVIDKGLSDEEMSFMAAKTRHDFSSSDPHRILFAIEQPLEPPLDSSGSPIDLFVKALETLESNPGKTAWQTKNIYCGGPEQPGKIAFIFPGQGSQYVGMGRDLVCSFPDAFEILEQANEKLKGPKSLSDFIYPYPARTQKAKKNQEEDLKHTNIAQPALGAVSLSMLKILQGFGIRPDATCGHSFGELTALCAAGWMDTDTLLDLAVSRGSAMASTGRNKQQTGTMLAVKAPLEALDALVKDIGSGIVLANRNAPNQGVLSGSLKAITLAEKRCKENGFRSIRLPVSAAFHSNLVKDAQKPFMKAMGNINIFPSDIPVFSNTTGMPYPADAARSKQLLCDQILRPVNFVGEIENMFDSGIRTFVEIGPKTVLTGLVKSILKDRDVQAVAIDSSSGKDSGMFDLAKTLCHLASRGYPVNLTQWEQPASEPRRQIMSIPIQGANYRNPKPEVRGQKTEGIGQRNKETIRTSETKERDFNKKMESKNKPQQSESILNALKTVQEGLKSMQALQMQTAEAHKKFLETQTEAGRTLQNMMDSTRHLAEVSLGIKTEFKSRNLDFQNALESASMPFDNKAS
ncbi:type I polyketide synthase, partial [Thermodesulfobacteriota bacterium]